MQELNENTMHELQNTCQQQKVNMLVHSLSPINPSKCAFCQVPNGSARLETLEAKRKWPFSQVLKYMIGPACNTVRDDHIRRLKTNMTTNCMTHTISTQMERLGLSHILAGKLPKCLKWPGGWPGQSLEPETQPRSPTWVVVTIGLAASQGT